MNRKVINKIHMVSIASHKNSGSAGIDQIVYYLRNIKQVSAEIDVQYVNYNARSVEEISLDYDMYGFYVDRLNYIQIKEITAYLKHENPNVVIVYGGLYPSIMCADIFQDNILVDYIICGEGEVPFGFLIDHINAALIEEIDTYPYIATKTSYNNKLNYKNENPSILFADDYYERYNGQDGIEIDLMIKSNACSHHCTFCLSNKTCKFIFRSPDEIIEVIKDKISRYENINHVYFADNDLFDGNYKGNGLDFVDQICDSILNANMKKLSFNCSTRVDADCFDKENLVILDKMKAVGFSHIFLGIEAGNDADLKLYGKGVTREQCKRAIGILKEHDIYPSLGFIMINPYSDLNRLFSNFCFLRETKSVNLSNYMDGHLQIEKYSPFYHKAVKDNLLKNTYSFINTEEYKFVNDYMYDMYNFLKKMRKDSDIGNSVFFNPLNDLMVYYHTQKVKHSNLSVLKEDIEILTDEFIELMRYFEPLYKNCDIGYCERNFAEYKSNLLEIKDKCILIRKKIYKLTLKHSCV